MPVPENMTMRGAAGSAPDAGLGVTAGGRSALLTLEEVASASATSAARRVQWPRRGTKRDGERSSLQAVTGGAEKQRTDARSPPLSGRACGACTWRTSAFTFSHRSPYQHSMPEIEDVARTRKIRELQHPGHALFLLGKRQEQRRRIEIALQGDPRSDAPAASSSGTRQSTPTTSAPVAARLREDLAGLDTEYDHRLRLARIALQPADHARQ